VGAAALLTAPLAAQSFNIDCGTGFPLPAATYGAAANQPGTWNDKTAAGATPLVKLDGSASTVTCGTATFLSFSFNNATTSGNDEALMDDLSDGLQTFTIAGLEAGTYDVYTYAWAPDVPGAALTNVAVTPPGGNGIVVGASAVGPPPFANPGHHSLHTVTITAGQSIVIALTQSVSFVSCNGIQIKKQGGGTPCPANIVNTGTSANKVDVDDLLAVISQWGPCPAPPASCPANVNTTGTSATKVDVDDLLAVIGAWGNCPP
jgi:hypothetical protein